MDDGWLVAWNCELRHQSINQSSCVLFIVVSGHTQHITTQHTQQPIVLPSVRMYRYQTAKHTDESWLLPILNILINDREWKRTESRPPRGTTYFVCFVRAQHVCEMCVMCYDTWSWYRMWRGVCTLEKVLSISREWVVDCSLWYRILLVVVVLPVVVVVLVVPNNNDHWYYRGVPDSIGNHHHSRNSGR